MALGFTSLAFVLPDYSVYATPQPPLAAEPAIAPQPDTVLKKLTGQWLTQQPLQGDMVMFIFAPDGTAFLISGEAPDGKPLARRIQYRINASAKPMHMDVVLNKNTTVLTVFDFIPTSGDLRIQMLGTAPGSPRPDALTEDATVFQRISDDTTLPPNTYLINAPAGRNRQR